MDSAHASKLGAKPASIAVEALTKSKMDGTPYQRRPDVEAEIQSSLASPPSSWVVTKLKSETLVYLARWLWGQQDNVAIGRVIDCLGRRIARIARDFAGGFDPSTAEEFIVDIAAEINTLIFSAKPTRRSEFLEISFRQAIQRRAINHSEKLQTRLEAEVVASSISVESDGEGEVDFVGQIPGDEEPPDEAAMKAEARRLIPSALNAVGDERHREAIVLHFLQDWPIFSKDATTPTLCSHFDMSERQIRNWIGKGLEQMRRSIGGEL